MTDHAHPDRKSPVEQAFDVFLYAPLGLVMEARTLLPQLVERGRQQMAMARMVGQFAVQKGQSDANKALFRASEQANAVLSDLGLLYRPTGSPAPGPAPAAAPPLGAEPPAAPVAPPIPAVGRENSDALAIEDYDSLAASHVIPRLPGLSSDELEMVRSYEATHRGRKTILNRIAQLQSS